MLRAAHLIVVQRGFGLVVIGLAMVGFLSGCGHVPTKKESASIVVEYPSEKVREIVLDIFFVNRVKVIKNEVFFIQGFKKSNDPLIAFNGILMTIWLDRVDTNRTRVHVDSSDDRSVILLDAINHALRGDPVELGFRTSP
jgi:hypothetical protein